MDFPPSLRIVLNWWNQRNLIQSPCRISSGNFNLKQLHLGFESITRWSKGKTVYFPDTLTKCVLIDCHVCLFVVGCWLLVVVFVVFVGCWLLCLLCLLVVGCWLFVVVCCCCCCCCCVCWLLVVGCCVCWLWLCCCCCCCGCGCGCRQFENKNETVQGTASRTPQYQWWIKCAMLWVMVMILWCNKMKVSEYTSRWGLGFPVIWMDGFGCQFSAWSFFLLAWIIEWMRYE